MQALREFRYRDFRSGKNVTVEAGSEMTESVLAGLHANKVDVDKMIRTRYVGEGVKRETIRVSASKRRGRPPKQKE